MTKTKRTEAKQKPWQSPAARKAAAKYSKSEKGKAYRKAWRERNRDKIRKWKREWAASANGQASARRWYKKSPKAMFSLYKKAAERRDMPFKLSANTFIALIQKPCYYCGAVPPADSKRNGIDRVDNNKGYVKGNVVPCCFVCNQMKSKRTVQEFINHIRAILSHQEKKNGANASTR